MLTNLFLREVPQHLIAGLEGGSLQVYGSVIRSVADGRIVGFLQETGFLAEIVSSIPSLGLNPAAMLNLASTGVQIVQNEQIKAGVETLMNLGIANAALGALGIGVSAIGFAALNHRITAVKGAVEGIDAKLDELGVNLADLRQDRIEAELDGVTALARRLDESLRLDEAPAERNFHTIAQDSHHYAVTFERRARAILDGDLSALESAEPLLDALALTGAIRLTSLAATGEVHAAQLAADETSQQMDKLTAATGLADLVRTSMHEKAPLFATDAWDGELAREVERLKPSARKLRDREAAVLTRRALLQHLGSRDVHPRRLFDEARQETPAPVLMMNCE